MLESWGQWRRFGQPSRHCAVPTLIIILMGLFSLSNPVSAQPCDISDWREWSVEASPGDEPTISADGSTLYWHHEWSPGKEKRDSPPLVLQRTVTCEPIERPLLLQLTGHTTVFCSPPGIAFTCTVAINGQVVAQRDLLDGPESGLPIGALCPESTPPQTPATYSIEVTIVAADCFYNDLYLATSFCEQDSDADGLYDCWEDEDMGVPYFDQNGKTAFYQLQDANPLHKDLYVEVDAMELNPPSQAALNAVIAAFGSVPNSDLASPNPDGEPGITLHIDRDELDLPGETFAAEPFQSGEFCAVQRFGTAEERTNPECLAAKAMAYRYCLYAEGWPSPDGGALGGARWSGDTGNPFIVYKGVISSLAPQHGPDLVEKQEASTFMHELGHSLGLNHGGGDDINCKCNYNSVMNYANAPFSPVTRTTWKLDYSHEALNWLDPRALVEKSGIGGSSNVWVVIGPPPGSGLPYASAYWQVVRQGGCVEWDNEETKDCRDRVPNRAIRDLGRAGNTAAWDTQFGGFPDWRFIALALSGDVPCPTPVARRVRVGTMTTSETPYDNDAYYSTGLLESLASMEFDCNHNGIADIDDIANGTSADANDNGIPDQCEAPFAGTPCVAWGATAPVPTPNAGFVAIEAGNDHSLGLKSDGTIVAWGGYNTYGEWDVPSPNAGFVAVAAGASHSLGLKSDSTIVAWGRSDYGQCTVPSPNASFVAVTAGQDHSLGLRSDGTIVAWGSNTYGQCNVPGPNAGFVAVAAGQYHSLGLKSDGTILAWGRNSSGQCNVPSPNSGFVGIAGGFFHSLGLKSDGSIVAWGGNPYGQCTVPSPNSGFAAVAAGRSHSLGRKSDGTIVAWGTNGDGQCIVPEPNASFVAVAAGQWYSVGLKADGAIVAWGNGDFGQSVVPSPNADFVAVAGGSGHSLGLKSDRTLVAWGANDSSQCSVPLPNSEFVAVAVGSYHSCQCSPEGCHRFSPDRLPLGM